MSKEKQEVGCIPEASSSADAATPKSAAPEQALAVVAKAVEAIDTAMGAYAAARGVRADTVDFLTDLLHFAESRGEDCEQVVREGLYNWRSERGSEAKAAPATANRGLLEALRHIADPEMMRGEWMGDEMVYHWVGAEHFQDIARAAIAEATNTPAPDWWVWFLRTQKAVPRLPGLWSVAEERALAEAIATALRDEHQTATGEKG